MFFVEVDSGGYHMAVTRIGKIDRRNQVLKPGDKTVPNMGVHQLTRPVQLALGQIEVKGVRPL